MNGLFERIERDLITARKERDQTTLDALGMLKSEVVNAGKEPGAAGSTDDELVQRVLRREVKRRQEASQAFAAGGRQESARKELAEAEVLGRYLPARMSDEDLESEVRAVIAQVGASSPRDLGAVMKAAGPRLGDRAEGGRIAALARRLLAG
jgi:uncharacterized protein YqeY